MSAKKTVCQLSSLHFALDTRIFYKYARSLKEKYHVIVIGIHPRHETIEGIDIRPFREYKNRIWRIMSSWIWMYIKAIRIKADCYHIHDPELLPCALLLRWSGKKIIIDIHENIADDIFDKEWLPFKKTVFTLYDKIERQICKNAPVILAEDSYGKRYEQFCKDINYIHNYVETDFFIPFRSLEKRDPLQLYYIGIILENRCLGEILSAMQKLHSQGIRVHFHCVGHVYNRVQRWLEQQPHYELLRPYLHFYGRQNLETGYKISQKCGIGLCLIKPMKNSIESKPTKLFEYMACGLPIVTSHFPLYRELVEDTKTGRTVDPTEPDKIAEVIKEMIASSEKREEYSQNGMGITSEKFNWETERKKLTILYERVVNHE